MVDSDAESGQQILDQQLTEDLKLEVASMVELCNLVRHIKDVWLRDTQRVLDMVKPIMKNNPLRGRLLPLDSHQGEAPLPVRITDDENSCVQLGARVHAIVPLWRFSE